MRKNIQVLENSIENLLIKKKFLTSSMALREDEDAAEKRKRERNEKRLDQAIALCAQRCRIPIDSHTSSRVEQLRMIENKIDLLAETREYINNKPETQVVLREREKDLD